jgi:hypothetical protein
LTVVRLERELVTAHLLGVHPLAALARCKAQEIIDDQSLEGFLGAVAPARCAGPRLRGRRCSVRARCDQESRRARVSVRRTCTAGRLLREQHERTSAIEREQSCIIGPVFHRNGKPILSYVRAWKAACETSGLTSRLVHDLRRTAVRNLERAGVSRSVAMKLTGHNTEAVYRRYAITSGADLSEGVAKLEYFMTQQRVRAWCFRSQRAQNGHNRRVQRGASFGASCLSVCCV